MSEYRYIDGTLRAGYFCHNCGQTVNILATGHFEQDWRVYNDTWRCHANRQLVQQLKRANPSPGTKPHYTLSSKSFS